MLDLHREKTQMPTPEDSRRLEKECPKTWGPPAIGQGRVPRPGRGGHPRARINQVLPHGSFLHRL